MKEDNGQQTMTMKMIKGIAVAALIAVSFFLIKQRSPQRSDMTGMAALTAVCVVGSMVGEPDSGAATEESESSSIEVT